MTLNRLFVIGLAILAGSWVWAYAIDLRDRADDQAFYARTIAPQLKSPSSDAFARGGPMQQWMDRSRRRNENAMLQMNLFFGALGLTMIWTVVGLVRNEVFWKKRNAPTREADVNAGRAISEVQAREGEQLTARTRKGGLHFLPYPQREVDVNFAKRTVTFRGFRFITSFIGNKPVRELTLPLADILGGRIWTNHGQFSLNLRTTAGKVTIPDTVQPFQPLAAVLLDAIEVNRKSPGTFAAALAREPKIRTPWYGWLILALALAVVAALGFFSGTCRQSSDAT
jgi:hypothetical protein